MITTVCDNHEKYTSSKRQIDREETYGKINEYFDKNEEVLALYDKNITSDTNRELFDNLDLMWDEYKVEVLKAVDLMKADKVEEARALIFGDVATLGANLQDAFAALSEYNTTAGKERAESNTRLALQATNVMIAVIIVGILIAVLLGLYISNVISKPIKRMVNAADALALGDVTVAVDVDTKDEVGTLGKAFQRMIENIRGQALVAEQIAREGLVRSEISRISSE